MGAIAWTKGKLGSQMTVQNEPTDGASLLPPTIYGADGTCRRGWVLAE